MKAHSTLTPLPRPRATSIACTWQLLYLLAIVFVTGGATCARRKTIRDEFLPPVVFEQTPTLEEITQQVNHSMSITQLSSNSLTISSPETMVNLNGSLVWERPHNFSLKAYVGTKALGTQLAAGSNAQMFWLQQQVPSPPTIFFARHDEFENQAGPRYILPVSPLWLREALGVVEIDPSLQHEEPRMRTDGRLEVVSYIPSPRGAYKRVLIMELKTGAIEQTLLYNHEGKLVATAQMSDHQYYAAIDWSLPHQVTIQLYPDDGPSLAFTIEVGLYAINQPANSDPSAFAPPDPTGIPAVNLVKLNNDQNIEPTPVSYTPDDSTARRQSLFNFRR